MEPSATYLRGPASRVEADAAGREPDAPPSLARASRPPGMGFGHDVLLAMIMAIAMGATVFLYR